MTDAVMVLIPVAAVMLPGWAVMRRFEQPCGGWPAGQPFPRYLHRRTHVGRHRWVEPEQAPELPADDAETVTLLHQWNSQPQTPTGAARWNRLGWPVLPEEWRIRLQERNYRTYAPNLLAAAQNVVRVWRDGGQR